MGIGFLMGQSVRYGMYVLYQPDAVRKIQINFDVESKYFKMLLFFLNFRCQFIFILLVTPNFCACLALNSGATKHQKFM